MANVPYDAEYEPRPAEQAVENELRHRRFVDALVRSGLGNASRCEQLAVAILTHVERRISGPEARELNLELPWRLRDLVRDKGAELHPRSRPERYGRDEFLARVRDETGLDEADAERTVRVVLSQIRELLSEKEASDVIGQLPPDMQALWAPPA